MSDWLHNLPVLWMAVVVFAATYLLAASIYWVVTRLAVNDRARAFKALSPGMLPPLGILFALLVGFIAVEVWNNFDKAKAAVATEASALRAVVVLAGTFPEEQKTRIYALIDRHIEVAVNEGWPAMARHTLTLSTLPTSLIAALQETLTLCQTPAHCDQRICRRHSKMGRDSDDGTLHLGRYRHGPQRQPACLRYSNDSLCDRHCSVAIADRRLQPAIYR